MSERVMTYEELLLPPVIVSKADVHRLVAEAEQVEANLTTAAARAKAGVTTASLPPLSQQLSEFLRHNNLLLTTTKQWGQLVSQLRLLKEKVPVLHMTFATVADPASLQQLAAWARTSVHPQAVIVAGLQPGLVGGVYLRTPNHVHDLSMRGLLSGQREVLVKELGALRGNK